MRTLTRLMLPLLLLIAAPALADPETMDGVTLKTSAPVTAVTTDSTTKPPAPAAIDPSYTIRPGDLLQITVWKEEQLDKETLVLPDGMIDFPLIGTIKAAGLTPAQVQATMKQKLKPFIPSASVTVVVKQTTGNAVSVIGQVARPGDVVMNRNLTVMQALSQVGGLTTYADDDSIVILRKVDGKETSITFDYSDVSRGRDLETNITLQPGDVIIVPAASLF